ncbi:MAG: tetratricopeptide repeat protein [Woeseiaceae bacterium]|nr:tetratricopeptide repeat protein [Woeseiaceae bacterium]
MSRLLIIVFVLTAAGCSGPQEPVSTVAHTTGPSEFVGSEACADCHAVEYTDWQGSHHELAMQVATNQTVLGDFDSASVDYYGATTRMYRNGESFIMQTGNASGDLEEFRVSYTFGIEPLQQYLTDFPDGRKQVLPFAWDTRPSGEGGQRWYHLHPDEEIRHDDVLHWTGRFANWNYMCAECHSTDLQVGYELATDTFNTTWSEVSVGCEACHGPASTHVQQANSRFDDRFGLLVDLDDRGDAAWIMNLETGIAERSEPAATRQEPESCGRCHSRRGVIAEHYEYGKPLLDTHRLSFLEEGLYHADGRTLDEVFVYGSFIQSKMYRAGVTCSDCHNPHSGELYTGPDPNDICAQCHLPTKFASTEHAPSNECVSCHMQDEIYMGVDARRDHSFRLPKTQSDPNHYGAAIAAARGGQVDVVAVSDKTYPAIARATLLTLLRAPFTDDEIALLESAVRDPDPLLRIGALQAIHASPPEIRPSLGANLLSDPVRAVRVQAALTFVETRDLLPLEASRAYAGAAEEYRQSLLATASFPESMTFLSDFEFRMGDNGRAIQYLQHALRLDPKLAVARHSYGLALVRERRYDEALAELEQAYELDPANARYAFVYAVSLNSLGRVNEATAVLAKAREDFPDDPDILSFWRLLNQ